MTPLRLARPFLTFLTLTPLCLALLLAGCGGGNDSITLTPPTGVGFTDSANPPSAASVPAYVDFAYTNQRGDARYATLATNAGVRVVGGFLNIWSPSSLLVDAGAPAPALGSFPAVVASTWSGIPGDATDGKVLNAAVHNANIQYVVSATAARSADQATAAYLDDRRNKGYSVSDGLGPLTAAWRAAAQQTTSITSVAADATSVLYNDSGNNLGVGASAGNTSFGTVVDFVNSPPNGSTEPAKRFFKYARPWRWSSSVAVVPALVPAKSTTPATDGGYISGHAAEATRDVLMMAYVLPERFQELVSRGLELGENRILAGMHSPLDVMSGRVQAQAVIAAALYAQSVQATTNPDGSTSTVADLRATAYKQAHTALMAATGTTSATDLNTAAHAATTATDRFADYATNKANNLKRLTYGFAPIADTTQPAVVPKGAELLLETRLPYLSAAQRRVVLKSTALASGYPILDDAEGWGRMNLFAAADGYGSLTGDVAVTMDAAQGGFSAQDTWRNDMAGPGMLTKNGSGSLRLQGANRYSGGTTVNAGTLQAASTTALGLGDVYLAGGTLSCSIAASATTPATSLAVAGNYSQLANATLQLTVNAANHTPLAIAKAAVLGGALNVSFGNGFAPAIGSTLTLISTGNLQGSFSSITVKGYKVTPSYSSQGVQVRIDSLG